MMISNWNIQMVSSSISIIILDITSAMVRVMHLEEARNMMVGVLMMMRLGMVLRRVVRVEVSHHMVHTHHSNLKCYIDKK